MAEIQSEGRLEKLVVLFDGEIVSIGASDPIGGKAGDVNIKYSLPKHLGGVTRIGVFPNQTLESKNILIQEGIKVKLGILDLDDSHRSTLVVLKKEEYERFNEPLLNSDLLSQKLSIYRFLTENKYNF